MISKALDAQFFLRGKLLAITNTEYDVYVDWSIVTEEKDGGLELKVLLHRVYGRFQYREVGESYKKRVEVDFETNADWKLLVEKVFICKSWVYPESVIIDFENKKANITLQQC